jgi:hypothetical protein
LWREAGDADRAIACYRAALGLAARPRAALLTSALLDNRRTGGIPDRTALEPGAWKSVSRNISGVPHRKAADEIISACARPSLILLAAPLPDDPTGALVPVSYKIVHEIKSNERCRSSRPVNRLDGSVNFEGRRIAYSWIAAARAATGAARIHFRALRKIGSVGDGRRLREVVVKVKNRYYDMRAVLASLQFNVVKHEPHAKDTSESKIYLSKLLPAELKRGHRSIRTVVYAE